jgi:hypothetical protein
MLRASSTNKDSHFWPPNTRGLDSSLAIRRFHSNPQRHTRILIYFLTFSRQLSPHVLSEHIPGNKEIRGNPRCSYAAHNLCTRIYLPSWTWPLAHSLADTPRLRHPNGRRNPLAYPYMHHSQRPTTIDISIRHLRQIRPALGLLVMASLLIIAIVYQGWLFLGRLAVLIAG